MAEPVVPVPEVSGVQAEVGGLHRKPPGDGSGHCAVGRALARDGLHRQQQRPSVLLRHRLRIATNGLPQNGILNAVGGLPGGIEEIGGVEAETAGSTGMPRGGRGDTPPDSLPRAEAGNQHVLAGCGKGIGCAAAACGGGGDPRGRSHQRELGNHEIRSFPYRPTDRSEHRTLLFSHPKEAPQDGEEVTRHTHLQRRDVPTHQYRTKESEPHPHPALVEARSVLPAPEGRNAVGGNTKGVQTQNHRGVAAIPAGGGDKESCRHSITVTGPTHKIRRLNVQKCFPQKQFGPSLFSNYDTALTPPPIHDINKDVPDVQLPSSSPEGEEFGPLQMLYDEAIAVHFRDRTIRNPTSKTRSPGSDRIAPICTTRIDIQKLKEIDIRGELRGEAGEPYNLLDIISTKTVFCKVFREDALSKLTADPRLKNRISRHMGSHFEDLQKYDVLEKASGPQSVVMHGFTVKKSSGGLRFVMDGRKLNDLMVRPPQMRLPLITDVISRILIQRWTILTDGQSWFYQFPLHSDIRPFFGINVGNARGDFVHAWLKVLCMGWSFAPCLAQRTARTLLPDEEGVTWVDNFILLSQTREGVEENYKKFLNRCAYVNATMHADGEVYGVATQKFTTLGLAFDLTHQRYKSDPKWLEKFSKKEECERLHTAQITPREFFTVFGSIVWHCYTTNRRLCFLAASLSFIAELAAFTATDILNWDLPVPLRPSTRTETIERTALMNVNNWIYPQPNVPRVTAWSDASSREWAALVEGDFMKVAQGIFNSAWSPQHIFYKELYAAHQAVALAASLTSNVKLHLFVDNLPAVKCIVNGHSTKYRANRILQSLFETAEARHLQISCSWVPSEEQKADVFTRGKKAAVEDVVLLCVNDCDRVF